MFAEIAQRVAEGLTEVDLRIEAEAKAELYEGHGKRSGNLRRAIQGAPGRIEGLRVRGKVGVQGVRYALIIHRRYQYITRGLERVQPRARGIISQFVRGR